MKNLLLIGCGNMAKVHCSKLREMDNLNLKSASDVMLERAEFFKDEYGFERISTDYVNELAQDDIDIVLVATTWQPRCKIVKDCLEAGKHVLAEKPLSLWPEEVDELIETSKRTNSKLRVGYIMRSTALMNKVKQVVDEGVIGSPLGFSLTHHQRGSRSDWVHLRNLLRGGVTPSVDCGIHVCDLLRWLFDTEPEYVQGVGNRLDADSESDNLTRDLFKMKNGLTACIEECFSNNTMPFIRMGIYGDQGAFFPKFGRNGAKDLIEIWDGIAYEERKIEIESKGKPTGEQMKRFINDIDNDVDLSSHLDDVRKSTEMALATVLASARNKKVEFPLNQEDKNEIRTLIRK